jgi:hypothetical protein
MGRNSYLGGSTIVYPGSIWFSGHKKKKRTNESPASKADLQAGKNIREALKAERARQRAEEPNALGGAVGSNSPKSTAKAERRLLHNKRVEEAAKIKARKRAAHQAQLTKAREKQRIDREQRQKMEAKRRNDPAYQAKIARRSAQAAARLQSVIVETRSTAGRLSKRNSIAGMIKSPARQKSKD